MTNTEKEKIRGTWQGKKINKKDFVKLKFSTAKGTVNPMKRQPTEWDKISASYMTDRGVISKIYKKTKKKKKSLNKK